MCIYFTLYLTADNSDIDNNDIICINNLVTHKIILKLFMYIMQIIYEIYFFFTF